jgi:hypothetical protein
MQNAREPPPLRHEGDPLFHDYLLAGRSGL